MKAAAGQYTLVRTAGKAFNSPRLHRENDCNGVYEGVNELGPEGREIVATAVRPWNLNLRKFSAGGAKDISVEDPTPLWDFDIALSFYDRRQIELVV